MKKLSEIIIKIVKVDGQGGIKINDLISILHENYYSELSAFIKEEFFCQKIEKQIEAIILDRTPLKILHYTSEKSYKSFIFI